MDDYHRRNGSGRYGDMGDNTKGKPAKKKAKKKKKPGKKNPYNPHPFGGERKQWTEWEIKHSGG